MAIVAIFRNKVIPRLPRWRRITLGSLLNLICWIGGLFFLVSIARQSAAFGTTWGNAETEIRWPFLIAAFVIACAGHALQSRISYVSQRYINYPATQGVLYRTWFMSQIAKYIPGGFWQVAARSTDYNRRGVPVVLASTTTLWEIASILAGALLVALVGAGTLADTRLAYLIAITALLLLIGVLLSLMSFPWQILSRLGLKRAETMLLSFQSSGNARFKMFLYMTILALGSWLMIGSTFYLLILAINPSTVPPLFNAVTVFIVSWIAGFLVIPTPSGLGVREAALSTLLIPYFPAGAQMPVFIALASRLLWLAAEGTNIGVAVGWKAVIDYRERHLQQIV